jgi:hypothetical protein
MHPPEGEIVSLQKHLERLVPSEAAASLGIEPPECPYPRSPSPSYDEDSIFSGGAMSLPPATSFLATPTRSKRSTAFPFSPSSEFRVLYSSLKQPVKKTCSYDAQLNRMVHDPKMNSVLPQPTTPQLSRKKRMGSIPGHLLKKAKRVFTPRSLRRNTGEQEPRRIKVTPSLLSLYLYPSL